VEGRQVFIALRRAGGRASDCRLRQLADVLTRRACRVGLLSWRCSRGAVTSGDKQKQGCGNGASASEDPHDPRIESLTKELLPIARKPQAVGMIRGRDT